MISFVIGSAYTFLLMGGCFLVVYKVLQYSNHPGIGRVARKEAARKKTSPSGGVIMPKTQEEIDNEANEELQAQLALLEDLNRG